LNYNRELLFIITESKSNSKSWERVQVKTESAIFMPFKRESAASYYRKDPKGKQDR